MIEQSEIVPRINRDCLLIALQRLVMPAEAAENPAPVRQNIGMSRLGFQRAVEVTKRLGGIVLLRLEDTQQMQRDQIAPVAGHHFRAQLVGPGEIAELIGRHRFRK